MLTIYSIAFSEENSLEDWKKFSKTKSSDRVIEYIRCIAVAELNLKRCEMSLPDTPSFGELGVFITIVNKG